MAGRAIVVLIVFTLALGPLLAMDVSPPHPPEARTEGPSYPVPDEAGAWDIVSKMEMEGSFTENRGQLDDEAILFYAMGDPLSVGLARDRVVFTLIGRLSDGDGGARSPSIVRFDMVFQGCNEAQPMGKRPLTHPTSFFLGNEPGDWVRGAASFAEVYYQGVYEGVDLRFYFKDGMLKYDFVLEQGVDPSRIELRYEGVESLSIDPIDSGLVITTPVGSIKDARPVFIQERDGGMSSVPGRFVHVSPDSVSLAPVDRLEYDVRTVIDPGMEFSAILGGNSSEYPGALTIDDEGNVYITGDTYSKDFPITTGAYCETYHSLANNTTGFITKINPTGSKIIYSTFFGGEVHNETSMDPTVPISMTVRADGSVVVMGNTKAIDHPVTQDAIQATYGGGFNDLFITVLDANGTDLIYSTYFGGSGSEGYYGLVGDHCLDSKGRLHLVCRTESDDLPVTPNAFCSTYTPDRADVFYLKLSEDLRTILACTYLGGADHESARTVCVDSEDYAYIAGVTGSEEFPTTPGVFCETFKKVDGGDREMFICKMNENGSDLLFSSFLKVQQYAGVSYPWVDVADNGTVYALGYAGFPEYPWTFPMYRGAYCTTFIGGDAYLAVYSPNMTELLYATIIGGNHNEFTSTTYLDKERGIVYLGGRTSADWIPTTTGCISDKNVGAGTSDLFLIGFSVKEFDVTYGTFLGGSRSEHFDNNNLIEVDSDGTILFTGATRSDDFPTTEGTIPYTLTRNQIFMMRIDPNPCTAPTPPTGLFAIPGEGHVKLYWEPTTYDNCEMRGYFIYRSKTPDFEDAEAIAGVHWHGVMAYDDTTVLNGTQYYYWVTAVNYAGESGPSNRVSAIPIGTPTSPRWLNATTGDRSVHLDWSGPIFDGGSRLLGYRVLRGTSADHLYEIEKLGNMTSYTDTEAVAGIKYYYAVLAFNVKGDGPWSNVVNITPAGPPTEPLFFSAEETNGSVLLTWEPPEFLGGAPLQGYEVYRGSSPDDLVLLGEVAPDATSYLDDGLTNGEVYHYTILAYSEYGPSELTYVLSASPFGEPGAPRELKVTIGDQHAVLTWLPPADDGGRPVIGYVVYFGRGPTDLISMAMVNQTDRIVPSLENSVPYLFAVATVTAGTEGPMCGFVIGRPEGPPSVVSVFSARSVNGTVDLTWEPPDYTGGEEVLVYRISRGTTSDDLRSLGEVTGVLGYIDEDVEMGQTYFYSVVAVNTQGPSTPSTVREVTVEDPTTIDRPGTVETFEAVPGDGFVTLSWLPPSDTGGSEITGYVLYRGIFEEGIVQLVEFGVLTDYVDSQVENNMEYLYQVAARNAGGTGPRSAVVNATPMPAPGQPYGFAGKVRDGKVRLSWEPPRLAGTAPVTGYAVWRGTSADDMTMIAEVGMDLSYVDGDVRTGTQYRYMVVPQSHVGDGEGSDVITPNWPEEGGTDILPLLLVLLVVASLVGALYLRNRMQRPREVGAAAIAAQDEERAARYLVEQVFAVHRDGRLMAECSREDCSIADLDLMSGMLIAVQGLMQDGLRRGSLRSIRYGDSLVLLSAGQHVNLAAVVYGEPGEDLREEMESTISRIEVSYAGVIEEWTGDSTALTGLDGMVRRVLDATAAVSREDVSGTETAGEVSVLSAVDLYRGDVRLKVAVVNGTEDTITDVSFEVGFDPDLMSLHRVEPLTLVLEGSRVDLGTIRPGERKTAAILFEGSPVEGAAMEGTVSYTDSEGDIQRVEMKGRTVGEGGMKASGP